MRPKPLAKTAKAGPKSLASAPFEKSPDSAPMAEIIQFRRAKKALERKKADKLAMEHRISFGRTKAEKLAEKARKDQIARIVDGALLPPPPEQEPE